MKPGQDADRNEQPQRIRLQRVLADAGVAARRVCEEMIEAGRVSVNGEVVRTLPVFVDPDRDRIMVDGVGVSAPSRHVYLMVHKPERTLVTTSDDPQFDRATIMELVDHPDKARLHPVGRLEWNASGLVLLTNDGELTNRLTHPSYGIRKTYQAVLKGELDDAAIADVKLKLRKSAERDAKYDAIARLKRERFGDKEPQFTLLKRDDGRTVVEISMPEGRDRRVHDVLAALGMHVKRLVRTAIGPLQLKGLASANWRELTRDEVAALRAATSGRPAPKQSRQRAPRGEKPVRLLAKPGPKRSGESLRPDGPIGEERPRRGGPARDRRLRGDGAETSRDREQRPGKPRMERPKKVGQGGPGSGWQENPRPANRRGGAAVQGRGDGPRQFGPKKQTGSKQQGPREPRKFQQGKFQQEKFQQGQGQQGRRQRGDGEEGQRQQGQRQQGQRQQGQRQQSQRQQGWQSQGTGQRGPRQGGGKPGGPRQAGPRQNGPKQTGPKQAGPRQAGPKPRVIGFRRTEPRQDESEG